MARHPISTVIEEHEENRPSGVEFDPDDELGNLVSPYDPRLIRVDPKVYSVRQVLDMIDDDELDLAPDFQRRRVCANAMLFSTLRRSGANGTSS